MCSLDVRFTVEWDFDVIFSVKNTKMAVKTHSTGETYIQNATVIDP
jgi:hypothetical protein